eukprot:TRINITY_DN10797_c0_g1_i1.p1 TRINITY_DN10797_c0_g1~~TRINITY_DN10797_c0_g1_i1.p1  ORF type:complete len:1193 (-),score=265.20 TRINITY_DN10797_c0_g1_i1:69-3647(-)
MKQTGLIPAGVQQWHRGIVAASSGRFAYCSSLAVYVLGVDGAQLQCVASAEKTITSLTWCPRASNLIAFGSLDNRVHVWDVDADREIALSPAMPFVPTCVAWSPHPDDLIAVVGDKDGVHLWNRQESKMRHMRELNGAAIRFVRWDPCSPGRLAVLRADGTSSIFTAPQKPIKKLKIDNLESGISDAAWDPRSPAYLLVVHDTNEMVLWDTEQGTPSLRYDAPSGGVSGIAWTAPGQFVTADGRAGVLRVWNVSQRVPAETVRIGGVGAHDMCGTEGPNVVMAFKDGGIGLYNTFMRRWVWRDDGSHCETVFDCQFSPVKPSVLATGGYDGRVLVYDVDTQKHLGSALGDGVLYSVSWSPKGDLLATACAKGTVQIVEVSTMRVVNSFALHSDAVFRVVWSPDGALILTAGRDGFVVAVKPDGSIYRKFKHPQAVFGVHWHPSDDQVFATGCHDNHVRVWGAYADTPRCVLRGHENRVFNVQWSPMLPHLLASGADDCTVRIWNTNTQQCIMVLRGHTARVRPLLWSLEIPWLLLSGAWDGTIRQWDVRSGKCISVTDAHHADVYGLAVHPLRPFTVASASRDTTVRMWNMDNIVGSLRASIVCGKGFGDIRATDVSAAMADTSLNFKLHGPGSAQLLANASTEGIARWRQVFDFFGAPYGTGTLLDVAAAQEGTRRSVDADDIISIMDIVRVEQEGARALAKPGAGLTSIPRAEALRIGATRLAAVGQLREACDLLVSGGEWDRALAMAPGVSIDYWRSITQRRAQMLAASNSDDAGLLMAAAGLQPQLCDFLLSRSEFRSALASATVGSTATTTTGAGPPASPAPTPSAATAAAAAPSDSTLVRRVASEWVAYYLKRGQPVHAAAVLLAAQNPSGAVDELSRAGESELAYALARAVKVPAPHVTEQVGHEAEMQGNWDLALELLQRLPNPAYKVSLLCCRYNGPDVDAFYQKAGLRPQDRHLATAQEHLSRRDIPNAVQSFALARMWRDAADAALDALQTLFAKPNWSITDAHALLDPVCCADDAFLIGYVRSAELRAAAALIATYEAAWRGFTPVLPSLASSASAYGQPASTVRLLVAAACASVGDAQGAQAAASTFSGPQKVLAEALVSRAAGIQVRQTPSGLAPPLTVSGGALPSALGTHQAASAMTGQVVRGPVVVLEDESVVSRAEALMWRAVNPLSPTGTRLHV